MAKKAPAEDAGDALLAIGHPKTYGAGVPGVVRALAMSTAQMGVARTVLTLARVNQREGFDCPGCAWPDPSHRHLAEFCENGAKAVAEEATLRRVTRDFFAEHSVADLATRSDHWLGQRGRLTEPMLLREGGTHYEPIAWDAAFDLIAESLQALDDPDEAIFYTSGRTSNEAAFAYQLFVRAFGTNNLPDCSNMCHESSGAALGHTLGIGKGTVTLTDVENSDLVIIAGQNPGTNHPRMLSSLEKVKANGGRIIAVNPLIEAGLKGFRNPQTVKGVLLGGVELTDDYVQIRLNGDLAFFAGLNKLLIDADALDHPFIAEHTSGYDEARAHLEGLDWADLERASGLTRADFERVAEQVRAASSIVVCWAMGLTQHKNSVPTIREIVNFLLLRGNVGRPGAGACPVRGHSNVQGDRTVGINERPPQAFLDSLQARFGFEPPREHGADVVEAIRRMRDGRCGVFLAVGGNFVRATPDTEVTERAMRNVGLTVHVSTKLNGSHAVTGRRALILPTLGRTERDQTGGREQFVTVEDSMGMVHASRGRLDPASGELRSEVDIVCTLAERTLGEAHGIDWAAMRGDYAAIRSHIEAVVPGFDDFERKVTDPQGFALPNGPRDSRTFNTRTGKARFTVNELEIVEVPDGHLLLQTIRSHDQFNTTIYGMDDVYRGITAGRRVVFIHPDDRARAGFADGDIVDLVSTWTGPDGVEERRAIGFRLVDYQTARGCVASYFPETNLLVPLDSVADESGTPTSKSVVVRLEPTDGSPVGVR
ncbi:FdhF/YdeP family oxidoreductase [Micropruina sonneratiae]|uniref:FdhF/YdeP family oxidoreductase n=1 Tax=Micropruina sonneratiae TaxID=2986940 RepID=UPI0022262666|nr:FdhF/YdeP family oxidoreductase [Micropruina sp. KQZ13P-5]MCW3158709.1 FdhF/YdeP family oxidoreductase [Micropruina sp. KQZ13P-5]